MKIIKELFLLLKNPNRLIAAILSHCFLWLPESLYTRWRFRLIMGYKLNLEDPRSFNEKLNWLKLYNRDSLYPKLVDKSTVKDYVAGIVGDKYIIPTYGVWDRFEDIDFDKLPNKFVLKSTNGGGGSGVVVCRDKNTFDKDKARKQLQKSMLNDGKATGEWVYEKIKPRFLAEKFMGNDEDSELRDYKIFCFNGQPQLLFVTSDRYSKTEPLHFDWFDINLNHLPFETVGYPPKPLAIKDFPQWEEMKDVAKKLSEGFPHVRVDLYLINGKVYFGELTFFHDAGLVPLSPIDWDYKIGDMLDLSSLKK